MMHHWLLQICSSSYSNCNQSINQILFYKNKKMSSISISPEAKPGDWFQRHCWEEGKRIEEIKETNKGKGNVIKWIIQYGPLGLSATGDSGVQHRMHLWINTTEGSEKEDIRHQLPSVLCETVPRAARPAPSLPVLLQYQERELRQRAAGVPRK